MSEKAKSMKESLRERYAGYKWRADLRSQRKYDTVGGKNIISPHSVKVLELEWYIDYLHNEIEWTAKEREQLGYYEGYHAAVMQSKDAARGDAEDDYEDSWTLWNLN
jgi:hypothetical protein